MVAFRVNDIVYASVADDAFATVLDAASLAGGAESYPILFGLPGSDPIDDPLALMDELARLSTTEAGRQTAVLIGTLRDDLMQAVAAAGEG